METFNLGQNDEKILKMKVCRDDSLGNSEANIVSNFRSIFVKIACEIAIPYTGSGPACWEREYMGKTRAGHK